MEFAEASVQEAHGEATKVLGEEEESDDEDTTRHRPLPPPPVSQAEIDELEAVARKARRAGGTTDQVAPPRW